MITVEQLQRLAGAGGPWRDATEEITAMVSSDALIRLADCLGGPAPADRVPLGWLATTCVAWPPFEALGPDGHPREGLGYPPLPDRRRLFAGGRLEQFRAVSVGDVVTRGTRVATARATEGRSGAMLFVTLEHRYVDDHGRTVSTEHHDLAYRSGAGASTVPTPAPAAQRADDAASGVSIELVTDTTRLFRFSALTANSHRIHYDQAYATHDEALPGLLVHGPLVGLFLLELPRRSAPGRVVRSFEFRVRRPVIVGACLTAQLTSADRDRWHINAVVDGTTVATANVNFEGD